MKLFWCLVFALFAGLCSLPAVDGARVTKVLPHYLDEKGRHTLSPSFYERDAYQDMLRRNPTKVSALRFDVRWTPPAGAGPSLKLRLELRGEKTGAAPLILEAPVGGAGRGSQWTSLLLDKAAMEKCGAVIAWRARLYHGDGLAAEMQSFLW